MMKIIFSFLFQILLGRKINSAITAQGRFLKALTQAFRKEASDILLRATMGFVATGFIIYSGIILGNYFHDFLLRYQFGTIFSIVFYLFLCFGSVYVLSVLFHQKKQPEDSVDIFLSRAKENGMDIEKIYFNFMEGLSEGIRRVETSGSKIKVKSTDEEPEDFEPQGMPH